MVRYSRNSIAKVSSDPLDVIGCCVFHVQEMGDHKRGEVRGGPPKRSPHSHSSFSFSLSPAPSHRGCSHVSVSRQAGGHETVQGSPRVLVGSNCRVSRGRARPRRTRSQSFAGSSRQFFGTRHPYTLSWSPCDVELTACCRTLQRHPPSGFSTEPFPSPTLRLANPDATVQVYRNQCRRSRKSSSSERACRVSLPLTRSMRRAPTSSSSKRSASTLAPFRFGQFQADASCAPDRAEPVRWRCVTSLSIVRRWYWTAWRRN